MLNCILWKEKAAACPPENNKTCDLNMSMKIITDTKTIKICKTENLAEVNAFLTKHMVLVSVE